MDRGDRIRNTLFYIIVGGIFTNAVAGAVLSSTYMEISSEMLFLASFFFVAVFCLYFYSKYTFAVVTAGFLLCAVAVMLYLWHMEFDVEWFDRLSSWVGELVKHVTGMTVYRKEYNVLGYLIVALFACFTAIFVRTGISFYFMTALGFTAVGLLAYMGYAVPRGAAVGVLLVAACLLMLKMSRSASRREYNEDGEPVYALRTNALLLLPICAAILIAAALMPTPKTDSGRNIMQNLEGNLYRLNTFISDNFGPKYFTFSSTGFSQTGGRLGGSIAPNSRHVMDVYLRSGSRPYLAGAHRDQYTGDRWLSSQKDLTPLADIPGYRTEEGKPSGWGDLSGLAIDVFFEILEPELEPGSSEYISRRAEYLQYISRSGVEIPDMSILVGRPTTTIFVPANAFAVRHSDSAFLLNSPNSLLPSSAGELSGDTFGSISAQYAMKRGTHYTVDYLMLNNIDEIKKQGLLDYAFELYPLDLTDERFAPYLELPENLPQRVRDLAEEITKDASNPYEKMKALESFLTKYPYTLTPGPLPEGADFVDWFLFEGKEGYCTYYATALAVMGRCVGVPTRYVEGFTLPSIATGGFYTVTNAQAHAWCDAFFSFSGWTTFEATAPFTYPFYNNGSLPTLDSLDEWSGGEEELLEDLIDGVISHDSTRVPATQPTDGQGGGAAPGTSYAVFIGLGAFALAALLIWLRYWLYRRRISKLEAAPPREAAVAYFGRIAGVLASNGVTLEPHETALAFARRVDSGNGLGVEGCTMEDIANVFARAAYSAEEIAPHESERMARCYSIMTARPGAPLMERVAAWIEQYMLGRY